MLTNGDWLFLGNSNILSSVKPAVLKPSCGLCPHPRLPTIPHVFLLLMSLSPEDVALAPPEAGDLRSAGRSAETGSDRKDGTFSRAPAAVLNVLALLQSDISVSPSRPSVSLAPALLLSTPALVFREADAAV